MQKMWFKNSDEYVKKEPPEALLYFKKTFVFAKKYQCKGNN